jgi:predicted kinase
MHSQTDRAGAGARPAASTRARAVVIAGPPASGKTTLGAALARALHHAFIDLDIVTGTMTRAALALAGADETALDGELGARLRDARYGALLDTAAANLGLGLGVVLTGPFTRERTDPARWDALRDRLSCPDATLICLELDEEMRRRRMEARGAPRDRVKLRAPACERSDSLPTGPADAIRLDGGGDPHDVLSAALVALGAAPPHSSPPRC